MRYYYQRPYYHRYHKHHVFTGIVTILLIMVLALIGLGAYQTKSFPFNVGSSSNNNPQTSKPVTNSTKQNNSIQSSTQTSNFKNFKLHHQTNRANMKANQQAFNTIGTFWKRINNILGSNDGSNTSLAPLFVSGNSNNSYRGIKNWLRFVIKANNSNDTRVMSIKPYDARATDNNSTVVYYRVRYNFRLHDHSNHAYNHIQIYDWTATFNHMSQIKHMSSPVKPAKDYIEN